MSEIAGAARRHWITAGFAGVAALLLISVVVSYISMARLAGARKLEEQSAAVRRSLARVVYLLTDSETAQRGYIITGDERFLAPAEPALRELPVEIAALRMLLGGDEASARQLDRLEHLVAAKTGIVRSNIAARREGGFQSAAPKVAGGGGRAAMDAIREHVAAMDTAEVERLRSHSETTRTAAGHAQTLVLAANALALVSTLLAGDQVRRGFAERARAQAAVDRANAELEDRVGQRTLELRQALDRLERENVERRELEAALLQVSEREQRRISEDLHDGQGQLLAGAMHLATAHMNRLAKAGLPEAKEAGNLRQLIREALDQSRAVARGLYPVKDAPPGLALALEDLAARTRQMFSLDCRLERAGLAVEDNHAATHLFRIAQEAVHNAAKHAAARQIRISLEPDTRGARLEVRDDGKGLPPDWQSRDSLGLRMMRHRAGLIGAELQVESSPGTGTRVICLAPIAGAQFTPAL